MKTSQEIDKSIAQIKTSGTKLDKLIQDTGVDVLTHFAEHKDTGLVNRLYLAMPAGSRKTALASWLMTHCAVIANADAKTKKEQPFLYAKDKATNPTAGAQDPWYNHKPDAAPDQVFDLQKAVKALLVKAQKATTKEHMDADATAKLRELAVACGIPESDVPTFVAPAAPDAPM